MDCHQGWARVAGLSFGAALCAGCVTVPPGHAALVTDLGGLLEPLGEGVHLIDPFASTELIDLRQQEHNDDFHAVTTDGAEIEAGTSLVTYRFAPGELKALAREVGSDVYAVAISPVVSSRARRVLGQLRLDELDTEHLRAAQAEITRSASAELRPLHILLESVDLREVTPTSRLVQRGYQQLAVYEQKVQAAPDQLRMAADAADQLRARAVGVVAAHAAVAPTLNPSALAESRVRAFQQLLQSKNASVFTDGAPAVEVSP
jgi:regulator of protease activity HflC (stomatin/prohibitin superfamily)